MSAKLSKSEYPARHTAADFQCFGPAAVCDGNFMGTKVADLGCFKQDGTDTNKYYHAAVVKSKINGEWYVYFEWGKVGNKNPQFQFIHCYSEQEAEQEYSKQLHSKNDKRGVWIQHSQLGKVLQAQPGKDCYLVRPQATRSTGLPDAKTIAQNDGADVKRKPKAAVKNNVDPQTLRLLSDLRLGTVQFTRTSMADNALPTQSAINEGRQVLDEARKRLVHLPHDPSLQVSDRELRNLTYHLYSRIPKIKSRNAAELDWILSANNISRWEMDLDAFEGALYSEEIDMDVDPYGGAPFRLRYLGSRTEDGKFIRDWMPNATRNKHSYLRNMKIANVWAVERNDELEKFESYQKKIRRPGIQRKHVLHQPKDCPIMKDAELWETSNTNLLFHGTRSVNVSGILSTGLRMPKQLQGVKITGAMFSSGSGLYWADDWKKSAGYTSLRSSYYASGDGSIASRKAFMFVTAVALGKMHTAPSPYPYTAPPNNCNSIFGKAGTSGVVNNEYVTFTLDAHKMFYLVEFDA